jgi:surface antigen
MQSDGNLVIYSGSNSALWSNGQLLAGSAPVDDYPAQWRNVAQDSVVDTWREYNRECTSFAAWRLHSRNHFEMPFNAIANMWGSKAKVLGYRIDSVPTVGSIAWTTAGSYGHVAWVQAVNGSKITVEDYNSDYTGHYGVHTNVVASTFQYIHFTS